MTTESPSLYFIAAGDLHTGEIPPERLSAVFEAAARLPEARFFAVPGDLTNAGLPEQYADLREHIRLENEILFPRAIHMEETGR